MHYGTKVTKSDTDPPPTASFITEKAVMNLGQGAPWDLGVVTQN